MLIFLLNLVNYFCIV